MEIREIRHDDWAAVFAFWSPIVDAGESYAYPRGLGSEEAMALWVQDPPDRTVVAVDDGVVLGSAKMGANRPGAGAHVATGSFMVAPSHAGRGVGRALGEDLVRWARGHRFRGIQFNAVVETNVRAVALWRSLGFEVVGTVPGAFRRPNGDFVGLHVMYLDLT